ncbi:glycosyltransferase [Rubrivirga sp. IMCC43871]|uniref:glycosyltransferase n=1 Tax=Rubrivirga sp. IMCC43871 TaxID=3391575 RepID=UPI00398FFCC5
MHVFVTTLGTRGDVEPYLALGLGLRAAGHRVTLSTAARFAPEAEALGLAFAPTTDGVLDLLADAPIREAIESMTNAVEVIRRARGLMKRFDPIQRTLVAETWHALQAAAPDLVVYHPKAFWGADQAFRLGIPAVMAPLQPVVVPTGERPAMGFPALPLGPAYRRGTHQLLLALSKWGTGRLLNDWREAHDAPARPSMLQMPDGAAIPVVHAFSGHVVPTPSDWPPHVIASGYWQRAAPDWSPPPALAAFLDAGPPPVYVGFGSMASHTPERTTRIVVDALARAGVRGLVATGWGGLDAQALPETVFAIDAAPHAALFPRCAAVVHHGGAGTTAAGLTAGRPTVVCPFFADQPYWGARVEALGVGPAPITQKRLTVDGLAAAIREATTSAPMRQRAAALGHALRAEDGVGAAVAFIEAAA